MLVILRPLTALHKGQSLRRHIRIWVERAAGPGRRIGNRAADSAVKGALSGVIGSFPEGRRIHIYAMAFLVRVTTQPGSSRRVSWRQSVGASGRRFPRAIYWPLVEKTQAIPCRSTLSICASTTVRCRMRPYCSKTLNLSPVPHDHPGAEVDDGLSEFGKTPALAVRPRPRDVDVLRMSTTALHSPHADW